MTVDELSSYLDGGPSQFKELSSSKKPKSGNKNDKDELDMQFMN